MAHDHTELPSTPDASRHAARSVKPPPELGAQRIAGVAVDGRNSVLSGMSREEVAAAQLHGLQIAGQVRNPPRRPRPPTLPPHTPADLSCRLQGRPHSAGCTACHSSYFDACIRHVHNAAAWQSCCGAQSSPVCRMQSVVGWRCRGVPVCTAPLPVVCRLRPPPPAGQALDPPATAIASLTSTLSGECSSRCQRACR